MKKTLALLVAMTLATAMADTIKLNAPEVWKPAPKGRVTFNEDSFAIDGKGRILLISSAVFDVDPFKTYTIKMTIKNEGTENFTTLIGYIPLYADGKNLPCIAVRDTRGSLTELAEDAKAGDTFVIIKNGTAWNSKIASAGVAFNAKLDYSDMPNKEVADHKPGIEKLENGTWKVTLRKPLAKDYPAGTFVRQHLAGGYLYSTGAVTIKPGEEKEVTGFIRGIDPPGSFTSHSWPVGTAKTMLILIHDHYNKKLAVTYNNPVLIIE